tara:strand:+ start:68908 stop:70089 length:1182 start_codon:yes stop_codon:yes gene_type:complete
MKYRYPFSGIGHRLEDEIFEILKNENKTMDSYTQGRFQEKFESEFENKFHLPHCIAVSNAVSGIDLIASELQFESDDEVICPAHTYCASAYPFLKAGANIKWADINPESYLSDESDYEKLITKKTKAIVVVHLYGAASNVYNLYDKLREKGIKIIEDCAQALGAKYNNRPVGYFADYSIFSFQSHKNISTLGEGGIISVRNLEAFNRIKRQRHNGHIKYDIYTSEYWKPAMSDVRRVYQDSYPSNYCMNEFQAIVGSYLIKKIEDINLNRKIKWEKAFSIIKKSELLQMQRINNNSTSSYHLLPIRVKLESNLVDKIFSFMCKEGIQCAKQYQPLYRYNLFNDYNSTNEHTFSLLKNTDLFYDQMISLPFHESLSVLDIEFMVNTLKKIVEKI